MQGWKNLGKKHAPSKIIQGITPPKINMEPENTPLEKENNLNQTIHFEVLGYSLGVYTSTVTKNRHICEPSKNHPLQMILAAYLNTLFQVLRHEINGWVEIMMPKLPKT